MADEPLFHLPADLTLLTDDEVFALEPAAMAEFNRVDAMEVRDDLIEYQDQLARDIEAIRVEATARRARSEAAAATAAADLERRREHLHERVTGHSENQPDLPPAGPALDNEALQAITAAASEGATRALVEIMSDRSRRAMGLEVRERPSLRDAQQHAPEGAPPRRLAVTAGVDIPGVGRGQDLTSMADVVNVFQRTARSLPASRDGSGREVLCASIRNEFEHTIDDRTSPAQVEELFRHLLTQENKEALVAGGGWCAPSSIRYDFFNIACQDGLVDVPTFGVTRGGIRYPTSPSLADAVYTVGGTASQNLAGFGATFSSASMPWLWTETDDVATVTGVPNKPTMRVPCPDFNEVRLECYGITMTAGNLTDDAYPEATANTLRLLNSAWSHAQNARILAQMTTLSTAAIVVSGAGAARPVYNQVVSGLDLAATDYRAKFGMCDTDVLEAVAPFWVRNCIVADLAWRNGSSADLLSVTNAQINGYFADRGVRIQWVNDWQVRGAGQFGAPAANMVAWPTTANFLVYAAGTFIKGNGLTLDLGVVRDSTLNAENDFTAAWAEECHLVARVGHESRLYTIPFAVNGAGSGAATAASAVAYGSQI